jgi:hypothetical protein
MTLLLPPLPLPLPLLLCYMRDSLHSVSLLPVPSIRGLEDMSAGVPTCSDIHRNAADAHAVYQSLCCEVLWRMSAGVPTCRVPEYTT